MPVIHGTSQIWNPLEDDGDALRLAYALNMDIYFGNDEDGEPIITASPVGLSIAKCPSVLDENDGSLRRAIVRAAAAMAGEE